MFDILMLAALIYTCIAMYFTTIIHYNWVMATTVRASEAVCTVHTVKIDKT